MAENTIIHEISLVGYKAASAGGMLDLGTWGSYGIEKLHLTLDAAWQDLTITAFFNVKGKVVAKKVVGKDGYADVPWEATKESTFAGRIVFEGSMNGQRRITTDLNYKVSNHSEITDIDPVPTDDRWNQFVTQNKEYRDGAYEAATKAEARAEDAEAASEDAQAAMRAAKASEDAAAASKIAAKNSEDKAKASADAAAVSEGNANASERAAASSAAAAATSEGNAAESAKNAASAAKKAADESVAANIATIEKMQTDVANKQAAAAASEKAAAASAVAAAGSAAQAEAQKTAAAKSASDAQAYMQTASGAATAANASAENAAGSKAAAGNSASAAAGSEQAAGASEVKAAESKRAAKASEQAAAKSAQAALESKTAAATSEVNAAASAKKAQDVSDSLPADYTTAVNDIGTLKNQMQRAYPDDSTIGENPWSSKHIVDMLCPPLQESGNPVVCYPVAGYALGVKAKWEPMQEGSGTPSPENIRPIKGRDSVTVNQADGLRAWGMLTLDGTEHWIASDNVVEGMRSYFVPNAVAVTNTPIATRSTEVCTHYRIMEYNAGVESALLSAEPYAYIVTNRFDSVEELKAYLAAQHAAGTPVQIAYKLKKPAVVPDTNGIFFSEQPAQGGMGDPSPDNIRPILINNTVQVGQTNTLTLPETVYGGEVDAVTGDGKETWKTLTLDGTEEWGIEQTNTPGKFGFTFQVPEIATPTSPNITGSIVCNQYPTVSANYTYACKNGISVEAQEHHYFRIYNDTYAGGTKDEWKAYLAAQYAAGTPIQVCYKLAEPVPFTATGAQPMPALAGANTVLTDADSATVTGRADPIKRITDLEDAVASQT